MTRFDPSIPSPEGFTWQQVVDFWKAGTLPKKLVAPPFAKGGKPISQSTAELLKPAKSWHEEGFTESSQKQNQAIAEHLEQGVETMNNFFVFFDPSVAQDLKAGKWTVMTTSYGVKPFMINHLYDKAWNKMCEALPGEIQTVIEWIERGRNKREFPLVALQKLALFLAGQGVPLVNLWR